MKRTKPTSGKKTPGTTTPTIPEMFDDYMAREDRLFSTNFKKKLVELWKDLLITRPLFWPDPIGGFQPFEEAFNPSRNKFTYSVARRGNETSSAAEWRYLKLLELLRRENDVEMRWLLLARWLQQEGICEPEKFLPRPVLASLVRRFFRSLRISAADTSYWAVITRWTPYFARLKSDLHRLRSEQEDPQTALIKMGYDGAAVGFAIKKGSVPSAIMHWVAKRRNMQVEKLQNAYSRTRKKSRKRAVATP